MVKELVNAGARVIVQQMLALHMADLDSIPSILYGSQSTVSNGPLGEEPGITAKHHHSEKLITAVKVGTKVEDS